MKQQELEFGTEPHKLMRVTDPDTSYSAGLSIDTTEMEGIVYRAIKSFGFSGCISDDVMEKLPTIPLVSISPRYRPLLDKGYIIDTGERRPGKSGRNQRVMAAIK